MKQTRLSPSEVLAGYDIVSQLYPHLPAMAAWRAWEYAAYRHFALPEPVLDLGCGDGGYFRLLWPGLRNVTGVEINSGVAELARQSGVYKTIHVTAAHQLPESADRFAAIFANCSLEHMDYLPDILRGIYRRLRPSGVFLGSVVTDKFPAWTSLTALMNQLGQPAPAAQLQTDWLAYHHLVNALPVQQWVDYLTEAGFEVLEHIPIAPEVFSRMFLLLDQLWHIPAPAGELGDELRHWIALRPNFPEAFRHVLTAALQLEQNSDIGSGAVFWAHKKT
ncbi:MAG: class I SAM-dependent methyltransferase [Verrucomicrobiota bacterium]